MSISILIVNLIYKIATSISNIRAKRRIYENAEKRLQQLNDYQKAIIYALYQEDNRTLPQPLHDGSVLELEQNNMIGKATSQYMVSDLNNALFPYSLQPLVSDEFSNRSNLVSEFSTAYEIQYEKEFNRNRENHYY